MDLLKKLLNFFCVTTLFSTASLILPCCLLAPQKAWVNIKIVQVIKYRWYVHFIDQNQKLRTDMLALKDIYPAKLSASLQ